MQEKATIDEIRQRFDIDVERFSNLQTGQSATMDSPIGMELVARTAAASTPNARHVLDVGCGAGNYTLRLLQELPNLNATLIDISAPMLERAKERVSAATSGSVTTIQGDIREVTWDKSTFDIIVSASMLHHLRGTEEWHAVYAKFFEILRPGGCVWIFDLVEGAVPAVHSLMLERWSDYLIDFKGTTYRDHIFTYVEKEDSPRPLMFQLDLLREVGFSAVDIIHKNGPFAVFGAVKEG